MEKLLSFACDELDCFLDEIKSKRRGAVSAKRKIIVLLLLFSGVSIIEISKTIYKDISSINYISKKATYEEKMKAQNILRKYNEWKKRVYN